MKSNNLPRWVDLLAQTEERQIRDLATQKPVTRHRDGRGWLESNRPAHSRRPPHTKGLRLQKGRQQARQPKQEGGHRTQIRLGQGKHCWWERL